MDETADDASPHHWLAGPLLATALGRTAWAISLEFQRGDPPVHLNDPRAADGI